MDGYRGRDLEGCHLLDSSVVLARAAGSAPAEQINPAGKSIQETRPIRDEIDRRVRTLLEQSMSRPTTIPTAAVVDQPVSRTAATMIGNA